jgi:hypothetical protein
MDIKNATTLKVLGRDEKWLLDWFVEDPGLTATNILDCGHMAARSRLLPPVLTPARTAKISLNAGSL